MRDRRWARRVARAPPCRDARRHPAGTAAFRALASLEYVPGVAQPEILPPPASDRDGDGKSDLNFYYPALDEWFSYSLNGYAIDWFCNWGFADYLPAMGDYLRAGC